MNDQNPTRQSTEKAAADLSVFDAKYATAQAAPNNQVPDGKYRVRVESVKLSRNVHGNVGSPRGTSSSWMASSPAGTSSSESPLPRLLYPFSRQTW